MTARQPETTTHVHRRDHRPCPWTLRSPLRPTNPAAIWYFAFAEAVRFEETFIAFINRFPAEFPRLAGAS